MHLLPNNYPLNRLTGLNDRSGNTSGFNDMVSGDLSNPSTESTWEYKYDNSGNLVYNNNNDVDYFYNHLNLPDKVDFNGGTNILEFTWDAAGNLLNKKAGSNTVEYVGNFVYEDGELIYILMPEGRIVVTSTTKTYEYHLTDHLGNVRVAFEAKSYGAEVTQISDYYPFGYRHLPVALNNDNNYLYSSKELFEDYGFGWYYFGSRYYDPTIGRWHGPDPALQFANPYLAMGNNPIVYVDPDGEFIWLAIGIGAVIGGYIGGVTANGGKLNPFKDWNWDGDTWAGIGLGAILGGGAGLGFYYAAPALSKTGFFYHFGLSGKVAAWTITGGVAGGAAGYSSGFAGGMLYSNGDFSYAHQAGVYGAKVGATVGSVVGAIGGLIDSYEPPRRVQNANINYQSQQLAYEAETPTLATENMRSEPSLGQGRTRSFEIGHLRSNAVSYMDIAQNYIGINETNNSGLIYDLFQQPIGLNANDPWCSGFMNGIAREVGSNGTGSGMARSWLNFGIDAGNTPGYGMIAIFERWTNPLHGHVGLVIGSDGTNIRLLGGNQSDAVRISTYPISRLLGLRWF